MGKNTILSLLMALILTACEAGSEPGPDPRLVPNVALRSTGDPAILDGYYDTALHRPCRAQTVDGVKRCLPRVGSLTAIWPTVDCDGPALVNPDYLDSDWAWARETLYERCRVSAPALNTPGPFTIWIRGTCAPATGIEVPPLVQVCPADLNQFARLP